MKELRFRGTIAGAPAYLARIDKRKARNLFELGVKIYLVPSNFRPFGPWISPHEIELNQGAAFDQISDSFSYYNCINAQTGYFPAYYINLLTK
jgi:hypothetical protein